MMIIFSPIKNNEICFHMYDSIVLVFFPNLYQNSAKDLVKIGLILTCIHKSYITSTNNLSIRIRNIKYRLTCRTSQHKDL